jgi:hypothetical protein
LLVARLRRTSDYSAHYLVDVESLHADVEARVNTTSFELD